LQLCERGALHLEDRLSRWFPDVDRSDRITLRQLLNHTAGIPDYGGSQVYHDAVRSSPSDPWSFARFAAETFDKGLAFEPGQGWEYSNPGYMLAKRIVELASGSSFATLVAERIADPLELRRTFVAESMDDLATLVPGMSRLVSQDGGEHDVRTRYHPGWVSHGVVASTSTDIAKFFDGLFSGRLVAAASLAEMLDAVVVPVTPEEPRVRKPSYGLGLMIDPESPWGLIAGHNGGGPGYTGSAFHARDLGISVCVLASIEQGFDAQTAVFDMLDSKGLTP
jgi:D-alanyl-D-alanine carboxypeptidase